MLTVSSGILVIEDHAALARFIAAALASAGLDVLGPVTDYAAALQAAASWAMDLALIDCHLAGQDSAPIADTVLGRGIPCVLISGYPRSRLPERQKTLPFVEKPFTVEILVAAVRSTLAQTG